MNNQTDLFLQELEPASENDIIAEEEAEEEEEAAEAYTVKHNGQEYAMTLPELITSAQKGMDYDRIRAERDQLKNGDEVRMIDAMAQERGISRKALLSEFAQSRKEKTIEKLAQQLASEGMPVEEAHKAAEENYALGEEDARMRAAQERGFYELLAAYPQLSELPKSVALAIARGETPLSAYRSFLLEEKEAENRRLSQALLNRETAAGSVATRGQMKPDAFLEEFMK